MIWDLEAIQTAGWVKTLDYFDQLGSTNTHAISTAADNRPHPRLILCDHQLSGRGRGTNRWTATPGALTFSLVIEPLALGVAPSRWPTLSVAVGGAICDALAPIVPDADVRLKWPNDVYADGRKLGGILVEVPQVQPPRLVIGIGLNVHNSVADAPDELKSRMVAVCDLSSRVASRSQILGEVLRVLRADLEQLAVDARPLAEKWRSLCCLQGRTIAVHDGVRKLTGACQGIDDDGALRIYTEYGPQRCLAGTIEAFE